MRGSLRTTALLVCMLSMLVRPGQVSLLMAQTFELTAIETPPEIVPLPPTPPLSVLPDDAITTSGTITNLTASQSGITWSIDSNPTGGYFTNASGASIGYMAGPVPGFDFVSVEM